MLYPKSHHIPRYCLSLVLGVSLISTSAFADPLKVTAIEWVQGRPDIPHIAVNGQSTMLQCHTDVLRYVWACVSNLATHLRTIMIFIKQAIP